MYQDGKNVLKFYHPETEKIIMWKDETHYKSQCYALPEDEANIKEMAGVEETSHEKVFDIVKDTYRDMLLVKARDPIVIGGTKQSIKELYATWESDIKFNQAYLYDRNLIVGKWYDISNGGIKEVGGENKQFDLSEISMESIIDEPQFKKQLEQWAALLGERIPKFKRLAIDIEVEASDGLPDPLLSEKKVTAISFESDDFHRVFILSRDEIEKGEMDNELNYEAQFFSSERDMLNAAFRLMESYPIILTFNGDMFDLPYLYNRASKLGLQNIPLKMMKRNATTIGSIHIDMFSIFSNPSLKIYAFNNKYVENSLESVSTAILGEHKIEGGLDEKSLHLLGKYCYNDSRLTYKLSSYNNDIVMNLLIILSRVGNMSIDDISRLRISNWIKSMLYFSHKRNGQLIPNRKDFPKVESDTKAIIKDKKYQGAHVFEPKKGIHFDVTTLDFASLYPSIIKTRNISYETVRCTHEECKDNKIPYTSHWSCTKKQGVIALLIGSLKELRVNYFKKLAKNAQTEEEREINDIIAQALKVFLNASYGVIGFESFPLYFLPVAESITAVGRNIIEETKNKSEENGMEPIYGDTDSIFFKDPSKEQIDNLISFTKKEYAIDLEVDKEYRYLVLSDRKKNYFGVKRDGKLDIKGLTGKKSHTPPFIKVLFNEVLEELRKVETPNQFDDIKEKISDMIKETVKGFDDIPIEGFTFKMLINKNVNEYKVKSQVIKAAEQIYSEPKKGQYIEYVKTWTEPFVKPIQLVRRDEVDRDKYIESLEKTMIQVTEPMAIDLDFLMGRGKATKIEDFY